VRPFLDWAFAGEAEALPPCQREVAALIAAGLTNKEIAKHLGLATASVRGHIERIRERLGFNSRTQIGVWAATHGLYPAGDIGRQGNEAQQQPAAPVVIRIVIPAHVTRCGRSAEDGPCCARRRSPR